MLKRPAPFASVWTSSPLLPSKMTLVLPSASITCCHSVAV
jgi:hypothetical protein